MNRYWIGDSGNWNDTSHWSATSGGVGGAVVPTLSDDVFFDNLSFTGTSTVTVNVIANCLSMSWSGTTQNVTFTNSAYILNVYGSLTLWTGSTWNFSSTGYLYMKATDSRTITTNGISIKCNRLYFDSVSGTWLLQDDLYLDSSNTYLINGTLNTNNFDFYASGMFDASSGGVKTLLLGSSTLTCTRYRTSSANSIYNYGTSTVIVSSVGINDELLGTNIFYNLILKNIDVPGIISLDSNQYVTNQLTINGYDSGQKRILITSNTIGTTRTITAPNVIASNVDFRDISVPLNLVPNWNLSGITGGSGDCGGNLNITFTSGQTQYWYGGSGNWSDSINWFTQTSGVTQGRVPLPQDDAIFDENSFSGTSTVIADCRRIPTTNMINVNQSVTFTPSQLLECYGSFIVGNNITLWGGLDRALGMYSRTSSYLSLLGKTVRIVSFYSLGVCTLLSDIVTYEYLAYGYGGKVDFNDFDVTTPRIANNGGSGSSMWLGNGTITMVGNTIIDVNIFENPTYLYSEGSTIKLTTPSNSFTQIFSGGNNSYNKLWLSGTHSGYYNITGNNTFAELKIDAGRKVRFTAGTTTTVGTLLAEGTSSSGITISSVTTSPHTLVKSGTGTVTVNYCTISYSTASASFRAKNSVNGGSNTGWDFTPTNRYWVGDTGNWDDPEHWSSTSGGVGADLLGADLYSGWNFTSGWLVNGAATINDLNTFTTTASAGLYRSAVLLTPDSWYKVTATGSTSSNGFNILQGINAGTRIQLYDFGIGAFYGTFYFKASSSTELYLYLRNTSVGVTDITTLTLQLVSTVPSTLSDAYFDANSFSTGSTVTINATSNCFDMNWTGLDQNVTLLNSAFNLNVYGSLTLWTGLTWTFTSTGYLYLNATDPQYITTNGIDMNNVSAIYFNGVGSWTNLDDWTFWQLIWISGTWNTNNKTITTISINTSLSGTRVWNCGSSSIYTGWLNSNGSPITINAGTSTIYMNGGWFTAGSNNILNDVIVNRNGSITINGGTFKNLTLTNGAVNNTIFSIFDNITVLDNLTLSGYNSTNYRPIVISNTLGSQRKITANNVVASNIDFRDIYLSGSTIFDLSGITGGSGDAGGNSGITFTSDQTQYFKHTSGSTNWSESNKWFTTSGGLVQGRVPLPQDDIIFDENSFSGISTLIVDVSRIGKSLDMSLVNTGVTISCSNEINTHGSVLMNSNILFNANTYNWNFNGDGNFDLKQNGCDFAGMAVQINRGTYTLKSDMTAYSRSFVINGGTFDYNDYNFIGFSLAMNGTPNVYLGNGVLEILRTDSGGWLPSINMNLYSENSTIKLNPSSGTGNFTIGNSKIYNKFWFSGLHTGTFDILSSNSFNELIIDAGRKVRFTAGTTNTITKSLSAVGTPTSGITISSITNAQHTILLTSGATSDVKYSTISYSVATNPLRALNSTNGGNNTGWTFPSSKYWIGGSGNWNDLTHWSATSGGVSGLTLGSELMVGGNFESGLIGGKTDGFGSVSTWTLNTTSPISGTRDGLLDVTVLPDPVSTGRPYFNFPLSSTVIANHWIQFTFDYKANSGTPKLAGYFDGVNFMYLGTTLTGSSTVSYNVKILGNISTLGLYFTGNLPYQFQMDNISVKEISSFPTESNTVIFDQNSFSGTSTVTIDNHVNCLDMIWTGITQNVTFQNAAYNLNVYGSLELATGLTWTFTSTGYLYFKSTTFGNYIKTNGMTMNSNRIYFDGVNGVWSLQDDCNFGTSVVYITNGVFNTNSKMFSAQILRIEGGVGSMDCSNSIVNLTIYSATYIIWLSSNTFISTDSTLNLNFGSYFSGINIGNNILNNINVFGVNYYQGSGTGLNCNNLTLSGITNTSNSFRLYGNIVVNDTLTINGYNSNTYRFLVYSDIIGTQRNIRTNNLVASNVDFRDIYLSGSTIFNLSGITGGSGDAGGNSGITFTDSQTQYWYQGTGNWSNSTKWFTQTNGGGVQGRVPLPQDDVYFDENSLSGTSTLTIDVPRIGRSLDMSGVNQILVPNVLNSIESYGNFILCDSFTTINNQYVYLMGRNNNFDINLYNKTIYGVTTQGNGNYNFISGCTLGYFLSFGGTGTVNLGNSTFIFELNNSGVFGCVSTTNLIASNSTLKFTQVSGGVSPISFNGGGKTYNKIWLVSSSYNNYMIFIGSNTINELVIDAGRKIKFTEGTTTTITKSLTTIGTISSGITISSITSGSTHNLVLSSGSTYDVRYANISYSNITPTTAARESINSGGNTGWSFTTGRYWIGGTGNWNDSSHWSATSGGPATEILSGELFVGGDFESGLPNTTKFDSFGSVSTWGLNSISPISGTQDGLLNVTVGYNNRPILTFNTYNIVAINRYVKISFDYKINSGSMSINQIYYGGNILPINYPLTGVTGTYNGYVMSGGISPSFNLYLNTVGLPNIQIDNVSIKEVLNVPNSTYDAIFDQNSFTGTSTVTINTNSDCFDLNFSGITQNVTFLNSAYNLNVYGSLTLWTGLTWTFSSTGYLYMKGTTSNYITTNNISLNANRLWFDGIGGSWTHKDNINYGTTVITPVNGAIYTNDYSLTAGQIRCSGGTMYLDFGSSNVFLQQLWNDGNNVVTGTFGTSTINVTYLGFYTFPLYNLNFIGGNNGDCRIWGNAVVSNLLTMNGTNSTTGRLFLSSNYIGTILKITAANVVASNVDFRDIYLSGSTIWDLSGITGLSGDAGGNSGITFTPSQTQYFKHTSGSVNWSDSTKWVISSGGVIQGRMPLPQDSAIFDENSFNGVSTITINVSRIGSLDMSLVNNTGITLTLNYTTECYGDFILCNDLVTGNLYNIILMGRGNYNLKLYNKTVNDLFINAKNGTYTNQSDFTVNDIFGIVNYASFGTFDFNDYDATIFGFQNRAGIIYMGNGTITITGDNLYDGLEIYGVVKNVFYEQSTIKFNAVSGNGNVTIYPGLNPVNKMWFSGTHSGTYNVDGSNTFNEIIIDDGRKVRLANGITQTINKLLSVNGTSASGVTITSANSGSTHTLLLSSGGTADVKYANISYSNATNPITARQSTDLGGNSGWTFSPSRYWIGGTGNWNNPSHWSDSSGGSSGITLGNVELVTGGDFESGLIGSRTDGVSSVSTWTLNTINPISGTQDGLLDVTVSPTGSTYRPIFTVPHQTVLSGHTIRYSFDYKVNFGSPIIGGFFDGGGVFFVMTPLSGSGTYYCDILYVTDRPQISMYWTSVIGPYQLQIDNISVKEVYSIPTSATDVIFDQNSFSGTSTVTINSLANCNTMDWTGINQNVTLQNSAYNLNIYGSLGLVTGLTWLFTSTGYLYFKSTTIGNFIRTDGVVMNTNQLYFDGTGGTWSNLDDMNLGSSIIRLVNGTWNTNGKNITTTGLFDILAGTKTLTLGSSIFKVGIWSDYSALTTTGLTLNCDTSTVWITSFVDYYGTWFNTNSSTFYNLKVTGRILTIQSIVSNLNITNLLTISGSTLNRVIVSGGQTGAGGFASVKNISAKNVDISHTDFLNIKALGEANWDVSNVDGFSSDLGGNSGITFAPSQTLYFNHTSGSCIWDDSSKWFLSDRITPGRIPLGHDDVVFDELSFSGVSSVNITSLHNSLCRNFNSLNINQSVDFTTTTGKYFTGNIDFNSLTTPNFYLNLYALKSCYINTNNRTLSLGAINDTATYNLMSDFTGHLLLGAGTFNTNNYNMNLVGSGLYLINQNVTFNAGSSIINIVNSNFTISMTSVFNCGTSIFNFTGTTTNSIFNQAVPFASPLIFNEVNIYNTGSYIFSINKAATFNKLNIINGTVKFSGDTTYSLGSLTTVNSGTTITSMVAGTKHTLIKTGSGVVDVSYANISNSTVSGSTLIARNSNDGGGNTNWIFPAKRYWIGGTGNWSDPSHWSDSSGGLSGTTSLGTNVIKNGTFDSPSYWDLYANWNISGGTLNCNTSIINYAYQTTIDIVMGRTYYITFSIISYTSGSVAAQIGTNSFGTFSGIGTYTGYTTTNTWNTLYFASAAFVGSIDNVILREVVSIPTESSDVIFDQNSFSGTSVVTVNTGATCLTMDWTGINQNVTLQNSAYNLNVYGSLILYSGLTWNFTSTGYLYLRGTNSGNYITTNGIFINTPYITMDGNGSWTHQDDFNSTTATVNLKNGTWNMNNKIINIYAVNIITSGSTTINMGSSIITLITGWQNQVQYPCTVNCGTSNLNSGWVIANGAIFYDITLRPLSAGSNFQFSNCHNLTLGGNGGYFTNSDHIVVSNLLTMYGTNSTTGRFLVASPTIGSVRKLTAANVIASNVDFRDIYLSGSTIWNLSGITGGSGNCGGNSGITFTDSQTQYWYQGSGSWSDSSKWFTQTSGVTQGRMPLPQDDAIFDQNSFSGYSTILGDVTRLCRTLDMSLVNSTVLPDFTNCEIYGSYIFSNTIISNTHNYMYLYGRGIFIIKTLNINQPCVIKIGIFNLSEYSFESDFSGDFTNSGILRTNNYNITITTNRIYLYSGLLYLGSSTLTFTTVGLTDGSGNILAGPGTIVPETSTMIINSTGSISNLYNLNFSGSYNLYNLQISGTFSGYFSIVGTNSINKLSIDAGKTVKFTEGTTTTVNHLIAEGTATSGITITSVTSGSTHTLVKTGTGAINVKYATISYSNASTPNVFRTRRSTNLIGNTGWVFPPQKYWIGGTGSWNDPSHWSDTSGGSGITETLGTELCLNSNFTTTANWTLTANVSINTGLGVCSFLNASGVNGVYQSVMPFGKSYRCTIEVKNYVSGTISITDGNSGFGVSVTGNGTYSAVFSPMSTTIYIMTQSAGVTLDLEYISVKEVTNFLNSGTTVYFDENSFTGTSTVRLDASQLVCLDMDWSGINQSVSLTNYTSYNAYIYGSLNFATGLTWYFGYAANYLYFRGTQTGNFIKTNGVPFGGIAHSGYYTYFDGVGGSWCNLDNMTQNVLGNINILNGIWNTNGKTITFSSYLSGSVGGLDLGSSIFNAGNGFSLASGFSLTGGTSTMVASGDWGVANGQTFYNVILNQAYQNFGGYYGGFTCKNLTRTGGNSTLNATPLFSDIIVTDTFTINGYSPSIRTIIYSWTLGTQRKITASNVIASNVDFRDIYLSGSTIWNLSGITGGSGDAGGNSGITFTPSQTQYWHVGTGSWNDSSKWFTQTNGIGTGRVPLPQDDIIFDENSFDSTSTLTINVQRIGRSLNMSRVNTGVTLISTINYEVYGSFILGNYITLSSNYQTWLMGRGFFNFNLYNRGSIFLNVNAYNGVYTNGSSFTTGGDNVWFWSGTFDFNDYDCNLYNFISGTDNSSVIVKFGNGTITFFRSSASALFRSYSSNQLDFENSTLKFIPTGSDNLNLTFGDEKFNKVWFSGGHTGNFDISGNNSFNEIKIDAGRKVRFTAGTSQSISRLIALGKPSNLITIGSIVSGSTHTLNSLPNDWLVDYCNIQDSITVPNRHVGINSVKSAQFDTSSNTIGWNLNEFSQNFNLWTKTNINTLTGFTAPDNTNSAIKISVSNITNNTKGLVLGVYVPINNIYTVSVYAKAAEYTKLSIAEGYGGRYSATFNLSSGSVISTIAGVNAGMESVGNGWFRCFVTSSLSTINLYTTIAGYPDAGAVIGVYDVQYTGTLNSGVYIWGPQLVNGYDKLPYFLTSSKIRYWIGNSGTSTDTAHWSLQANGVSGATIPTSSESAVFDRYSFTSTGQTVTLSGNTSLAYLHMDDVPSGLTLSSTYDLNVYDSIYLASGMIFDVNNLYFKSPYTGNVINTNNTILNTNEIYFDNATGIWLNGDNFTTTANIYHINGTWSVNRIVTIKNYLLGVGTKTLLLDSSTFNVQNFDIKTNSTNFTVTPSTSKIIATSGVTMLSQTLYDVQTNSFDAISPTVHNLTLSGDTWVVAGIPIITGTLQIDGNSSTDRFLLKSDTLKTQRTITAQNTMMSNVDIIDIKGNDWNLTGTSIGDGGGNTGITFTPATTQYWNQGSGDWSDLSKWTSRVPLLQDTAVFDENSFTGTSTLNINMTRISSINMSGVTQQVTLNDMNVYGDISLNDYVKVSNLYLYGRNNYLNLSGDTNVFMNGNYTNQSNFKSNSLTLLDGTFSLGNYTLEVNSWNVSGITIPDNSVIKFNSTGSTNFTFNGGNNNYYNLWLSGTHTGYYDIFGNNNFNNIKIDDGRKVRFESNSTQTINSLSAQAISGITITSTSTSQHTLIFNQYNPFLVFNYLDLSYSKVLPLDRIYAVNSINSGNNLGWIFTDSPLFVWIQSNWGILVDENGKFLW